MMMSHHPNRPALNSFFAQAMQAHDAKKTCVGMNHTHDAYERRTHVRQSGNKVTYKMSVNCQPRLRQRKRGEILDTLTTYVRTYILHAA